MSSESKARLKNKITQITYSTFTLVNEQLVEIASHRISVFFVVAPCVFCKQTPIFGTLDINISYIYISYIYNTYIIYHICFCFLLSSCHAKRSYPKPRLVAFFEWSTGTLSTFSATFAKPFAREAAEVEGSLPGDYKNGGL